MTQDSGNRFSSFVRFTTTICSIEIKDLEVECTEEKWMKTHKHGKPSHGKIKAGVTSAD
jgi:hypothetical protein